MKRLEGKVAVITGGAQGIGKAAVELFASEGCSVAIWDMASEQGLELSEQLNQQGYKTIFQKVNVAAYSEVSQATYTTLENFGKIDILINNAGITKDATIAKMTPDQWAAVIAVNLTGVFNCCSVITPNMVEHGFGRVINTSSVVGLYGNFGQTNYAATKAGVIGITKTLAKELGKKGITVNAVAPGFIETEMVKAMPEKVIAMMEEKTPVKRLGKPIEIAYSYLFLASDEAAYINGTVLSVDGGVTL